MNESPAEGKGGRGRPPTFSGPAKTIKLTLPADIVNWLHETDHIPDTMGPSELVYMALLEKWHRIYNGVADRPAWLDSQEAWERLP